MNKYNSIVIILSFLAFASCDDGRIYEKDTSFKEGKIVKTTGTITGLDNWQTGYNIAIAGFDDEDPYAIISRVITPTDAEKPLKIVLAGIDDNVTHMELCVLNRLRQRVVTLQEFPLEETRDTIRFDIGNVNASMYGVIQSQLFNISCTACHGGNGFAAAGLNLTEGNSYAAMLNQPSKKVEGLSIVTPGDKENSVLHLLLNTDLSSSWHQNHADMLNKERSANLLKLIDDWIDGGADE